jgi:hypothetical protein
MRLSLWTPAKRWVVSCGNILKKSFKKDRGVKRNGVQSGINISFPAKIRENPDRDGIGIENTLILQAGDKRFASCKKECLITKRVEFAGSIPIFDLIVATQAAISNDDESLIVPIKDNDGSTCEVNVLCRRKQDCSELRRLIQVAPFAQCDDINLSLRYIYRRASSSACEVPLVRDSSRRGCTLLGSLLPRPIIRLRP